MDEQIKAVFASLFNIDPAQVNDDTSPDTLPEWESLKHMNLVVALEEAFGVEFTEEEIIDMVNVAMIKEILREKLGDNAGMPASNPQHETAVIPENQEDRAAAKVEETPRIIFLERDAFTERCLNDPAFRALPSGEKIRLYRENGHVIGDDVIISNGAVLIGNRIRIEDGVHIGENTVIEAPEIRIGLQTAIGNGCNLVASSIVLGDYNRIADRVMVDISGGRYPDSQLQTGKGCLIAYEVYINACRAVTLGEQVAISPKAFVYTHSYWQSVLEGYNATFEPVVLEDNCWIGSGAMLLPGVTVGEGSIVMGNSLVTSNIPPFTLAGGVPARKIKDRIRKELSDAEKYRILLSLLSELETWIAMHGERVERLAPDKIQFTWKGGISEFILLDPSGNATPEDADIVLCLQLTGNVRRFKTALEINTRQIHGRITPAVTMITEFLRRKGIRFYES